MEEAQRKKASEAEAKKREKDAEYESLSLEEKIKRDAREERRKKRDQMGMPGMKVKMMKG